MERVNKEGAHSRIEWKFHDLVAAFCLFEQMCRKSFDTVRLFLINSSPCISCCFVDIYAFLHQDKFSKKSCLQRKMTNITYGEVWWMKVDEIVDRATQLEIVSDLRTDH